MLASLPDLLLASVLLVSAGAKLARPRAAQAALATYGLRSPRARAAMWGLAVAVEGALAVLVALGSDLAAWAAAALMAGFAALLARALRAGRAGQPCGCLGARGRVGAGALVRALVLAVAFAALPFVPDVDPAATGWLALGLGLALAGLGALAVLVLALAREVGELRAALGPAPALEIPGEGPPLGVPVELIERFTLAERTRYAVAVFSSEGCALCQSLRPAISLLRNDPLLAVLSFDEVSEREVWHALAIPGSPYAVVLGLDGTVLAQGTFNGLRQLESLVATAAARERELLEAFHA
ncbi:hypothetical protein Q5424_27225 [Conexibacter sp. JD483]|uniref:MauE/DoxX family redox-associated membrane protein n=1 Tax=unclassified Conexibacter TaxID=2627773 RepID=UPI002727FB20|nr:MULTISPECIES: MauE/DoxX family redox-associated membrane protein [unclassified Conexibacter]MDO8189514.1 hypothetical protein [Conexibacter sp. CPCC 205706]MDO8202096.1 hypothetical protein [Conexibacter sp. CPCC 205762]MDR9372822.1 hypothetical protein [Conexibacter sp. JD483]